MVQMFPTFFDRTLEHLFLVEKLPRLSYELFRHQDLKVCQAALRFFRMFLWCIPDCDANLLADFNFFATSIAQLYKVEGTGWFALTDDEYYSLATKVNEELRKCYAEMNRYRQHLILCSLKAEPFTSDETIGFLDSVHVASNDLLNTYVVDFLPITSHVETLQETVFLLRNFVYYTPMGGENYTQDISFLSLSDFDANPQTNLIFQFNVHDWANKAACFFLLYWLIEREDEENSEEIRRLYTDLQQKVGPCNPEFIKLCFQNIKVPKMKQVDRLLYGEFVSRFVDLFLQNLMLILNDEVRMDREGLILLITFLADPPANTVDHSELSSIREQIYAVLDQASVTICFFGETNMDLARGKTILDDLQKSIDEVRGEIENLYVEMPHSSWSNFPRIDRLGHFECLLEYLENLKETMNKNKNLVPFLKPHINTIQEELLPLRLFMQDTPKMQNEYNGLKDIWEQIMSLLYQADFAIKSSFFIDNAIWYNLTCLSFVVRKIKDIRYKVMNIEFETQTEGSQICRTESILPLMSSIDVPKPPTSTSIVEVLVGFKKEIELLLDRLECGSEQLDIVSIVGMGGIGKTTLARKLYNEPSVVHRFHKRAFCSVSQVYRKRNVLLHILSDLFPIDDEIRQMSDEDLADRLRKSLKGFKYLIVLDDIWDINVWVDLRDSFPDDHIRSRVIFTTRINRISWTAIPDSTPCSLPFLSDDESWELLEQKVFHKDPCPPNLLKVGKLIAKNCKGLPLTIVVIAGLLARTDRSLLQWNDIIKLSYKQLPEALKSCFLYLGAFCEDEILDARRLTLLWVAEGFVLKSGSRCLHKIAKKYLNDLGDRNLVTVTERSCNGGIRRCRVQDLIRDFYRTKAQEEHFMCYTNAHNKNFPIPTVLYQYLININAEWRSFVDTKPRGPTVHSLLFFSGSLFTFPQAYFQENSLQSFLCNFKLVQWEKMERGR